MRAESAGAGLGGRVYEAGDFGAGGRVGEVVALCVEELLALRGGHNHVVDGDGAEAGGVDERLGRHGGHVAAGPVRDVDFPARAARGRGSSPGERADAHDGGAQGDDAAGILEEALQAEHQAVGVDDARRRALQGAGLGNNALAMLADLLVRHPSHRNANLVDAKSVDPLQGLPLRVVLGDEPLARPAVGDAVPVAELVQQVLAAEAELRLEGVFAVVDAGVDDLAVARAGLCADGGVTLYEHGGGAWLERELAGNGEADDAAADDLEENHVS